MSSLKTTAESISIHSMKQETLCETKKCNICLKVKPLTDFYSKGAQCRSCRNEYNRIKYQEVSIKKPQFAFDELLARWVSTHARKPNRGAWRWLRGPSAMGMCTCEKKKQGEEVVYYINQGKSKRAYPYYGHPIYQNETNNLPGVRQEENKIVGSEPEILGDSEFDSREYKAKRSEFHSRGFSSLSESEVCWNE